MAVHRLGELKYKELTFHPQLWKGVDTEDIGDILSNFYPPIQKVTSLSENKTLSWFYGSVGTVGLGSISVLYPYSEDESEGCIFRLRNVDFSTFPFIHLKATPHSESEFIEWRSSEGENLSYEPDLVLYEDSFPDVTGFIAVFGDASNVGI